MQPHHRIVLSFSNGYKHSVPFPQSESDCFCNALFESKRKQIKLSIDHRFTYLITNDLRKSK